MFFFFSSRRRHTRSYGDWSSDVCSSDLRPVARSRKARVADVHEVALAMPHVTVWAERDSERPVYQVGGKSFVFFRNPRSEERRVGKECGFRGTPYPENKAGMTL